MSSCLLRSLHVISTVGMLQRHRDLDVELVYDGLPQPCACMYSPASALCLRVLASTYRLPKPSIAFLYCCHDQEDAGKKVVICLLFLLSRARLRRPRCGKDLVAESVPVIVCSTAARGRISH